MKVAEALSELQAIGYRVINDIPRKGYNIDHVIVGPAGVFAVETKYRSGYGEIEFRNGEGLFVGGRKEENDPLAQARGNAAEVSPHDQRRLWCKPMGETIGSLCRELQNQRYVAGNGRARVHCGWSSSLLSRATAGTEAKRDSNDRFAP